MRIPIIAGNWKMYKTASQAVFLFQRLEDLLVDVKNVEIVVCPPFIALRSLQVVIEQNQPNIYLGAQNMHWEEEGAYTGEVSPTMLKALSVKYVILGHSERRQLFSETDEMIHKKVASALAHGLIPILCVGETLEQRERGETEMVVHTQVTRDLEGISENEVKNLVIAYEPIWAIGTGRTATPEVANETIKFIRRVLAEAYKPEIAEAVCILYGGSVKPDNIGELMGESDIDGALVGGASLDPDSFARIVKWSA
ncbi:MAG: triose-phosphate isomerase [Actinomycetota bacterium]